MAPGTVTDSGEVGDITPGEGHSTLDIIQRGLKMSPEEINQHVSDVMNDSGGDPAAQGAAIRAEEARLTDRSTQLSKVADANPNNLEAKLAADNAFKDLTDFHNGPVAKLKTGFHARGMALQAEIPVDLTTYNGLREAWLRENGTAPSPKVEPTLRRTASNVRRIMSDEEATRGRLGQEIDRVPSKLTHESVRDAIIERMKDAPCRN